MANLKNYQQKHINAIYYYYKNLRRKNETDISLRDVIISWLTEGHAEKFREEFIKNNSVLS